MNVYLAIAFSLLATLATARILPGVPPDLISRRSFYESELNITTTGSLSAFDFDGPATAVDGDDAWARSINRGAKLLQGMKMGDKEAGQLYGLGDSADSPCDGDLHNVLESWGYRDNAAGMKEAADKYCDMDSSSMLDGQKLKKTFDELGMGTKSKNKGGPNECFQIEHYNSAAVILDEDGTRPAKYHQYYKAPCGTEFRETGAEHTVGVNGEGGAVFAMDIKSPAKAARSLWGRAPKAEELPHIRSFSDISWAFWNRAAAGNIQNIKYFFVTTIINTETNRHIRKALKTLTPPKTETEGWPGVDFDMETDAGKALLGSPVGRWAGYFLMQHKRQLGGNKFISKVRLFKSEKAGLLAYLLFYVDGPVSELERRSNSGLSVNDVIGGARDADGEMRVLARSDDGRNIVREHVSRVKL
jgi:hypothetical protein